LPDPEQIGLAMPKPITRQVKPREITSTPLAPEVPWADASATHRLGLIVQAGAVDRYQLPVEVDVKVPADLAAKPVRAFLMKRQSITRELLAQLDSPSESGASRLVLVLDERLPKDEQATIHVYLGLPQPAAPLASAVRTRTDAQGRPWIENDRFRVLLGREGAHVYRWEVKEAGSRDLTMPGETGWTGFSDINTYRHSAYQLNCTARGPALVEFHCADAAGHEKTLRFYGGASWMEVLFDEATPLYWDFDNPKNFASDGPTPGTWLFSNGQSGAVGREADGVPAQVKAPGTRWGIKFNADKLALGLITPETAAHHIIAPGAGAGGVGIESSSPAQHFVTFAGVLDASPAETMNRLQSTLDLKQPVSVSLFGLQAR